MKRKKGSILVEAIISLSILLLAASISANLIKFMQKSFIIREERERANRLAYAIENEIKHNLKIEEILNELNINTYIKYEFSQENFEKLLSMPLFSLNKGEGVEIKIKEVNENNTILLMNITIKDNTGAILSEREFVKTNWVKR
ncbi:type IV pilus modification PilV family protein [Caproiciproducens sp. MSJ-32]|uniref:type IV pilus modification PilV family protein n=1 Tax=Caproiciproducens sp. MSJ-32 TaxID=2841527 RepID=UPI001C11E11B|nr:type II secretion system protein [Caproiciproducens sp. MSJ-32]MBU5454592.1 type II secretion system GspH family protein [Caproiciproducens sp. MSJ-32]